VGVLRPRTNPIGPARGARRHGWEKGVMDGVLIRDHLRTLSVRISFAVSYGSVIEKRVGDGRGNVGIIDDHKITRGPSTSQHQTSPADGQIDTQSKREPKQQQMATRLTTKSASWCGRDGIGWLNLFFACFRVNKGTLQSHTTSPRWNIPHPDWMWKGSRSRVNLRMGNRSTADDPPAVPNPLETERLAGSEISLSVGIATETYLVPSSRQILIFTFEIVVGFDRSAVELTVKRTGRPSSGASSVLLMVVALVKTRPCELWCA